MLGGKINYNHLDEGKVAPVPDHK
jgi:t-SNARE complex subunit (syntaxin)